jgi:hypothetical protein
MFAKFLNSSSAGSWKLFGTLQDLFLLKLNVEDASVALLACAVHFSPINLLVEA